VFGGRAEGHQHAVAAVCRKLVADALFCLRSRGANDLAQPLLCGTLVSIQSGEVFVDRFRFDSVLTGHSRELRNVISVFVFKQTVYQRRLSGLIGRGDPMTLSPMRFHTSSQRDAWLLPTFAQIPSVYVPGLSSTTWIVRIRQERRG
jgi:hypothetical protein